MQKIGQQLFERHIGRPLANVTFSIMHRQVRLIEKSGITMMHTARPFSYYRKVFYKGNSASRVLRSLQGKTIVDVGCGYTPFAADSMFQACFKANIDFYGVDPLIGSELKFGYKERALARAMGSQGRFNANAPGLSKAISAYAQDLPFEDHSVDQILCSYLLFVWIEDQAALAEILNEFLRVLKPGGVVKLYPLHEWRFTRFKNRELKRILSKFELQQSFVHGGLDLRVTPAMLTEMTKLAGYFGARAVGQDQRTSRTIAIEVGMQNSGLAVALAVKYFSPLSALPGAVFSIWHNVTGSVLAALWNRKP